VTVLVAQSIGEQETFWVYNCAAFTKDVWRCS